MKPFDDIQNENKEGRIVFFYLLCLTYLLLKVAEQSTEFFSSSVVWDSNPGHSQKNVSIANWWQNIRVFKFWKKMYELPH